MSKFIDLTGNRYSRLVVLGRAKSSKAGRARWRCICDCSGERVVLGCDLKAGKTKSCGCLRREAAPKNRKKTHGETGTRLYRIWATMKARASNPHSNCYKHYGGKGIIVCAEWRDSFENFRDWAMSSGYRDDLTIDRVDNNGDYDTVNCVWSTYKTQANNRSNNRMLNIHGHVRTLSEWATIAGISAATLAWRIDNGWPAEDLFIAANLNNKNIRRQKINE